MTISYQFSVHTASLGGFARLLLRWKGSVYKLVIKETVIFGFLYAAVSLIYRILLSEDQRRNFENVARHVGDNKNLIPLTFVLGFYVQFVVTRWWDQYLHYPWPDRILNLVILYVPGLDERSRIIRRTMARWLCLSTILLTRGVSVVAKKRFPTLQHLVDAGLMTKEEEHMYEEVRIPYAKFWVPMLWFTELLKVAKREKKMDDPSGIALKQVMDEVATYKTNQWRIWSYDWVSVPVVYTQVATLAVYVYFIGCLFSRQFLDPEQKYEHFYVDFYFPVFTFLQFFFYVGWLKVAESLINPWGEDDDDFEVNWFIDRHVQVAFLIADEKFGQLPTLEKDRYWNTTEVKVPYTSASAMSRRRSVVNIGSTINLEVPLESQKFLNELQENNIRVRRSTTASRLPDLFGRQNDRRSSAPPNQGPQHLSSRNRNSSESSGADGPVRRKSKIEHPPIFEDQLQESQSPTNFSPEDGDIPKTKFFFSQDSENFGSDGTGVAGSKRFEQELDEFDEMEETTRLRTSSMSEPVIRDSSSSPFEELPLDDHLTDDMNNRQRKSGLYMTVNNGGTPPKR